MKILLVEDDHHQASLIKNKIEGRFHGCTVELVKTEFDFRSRLGSFLEQPPDLVVIDVMLRWTSAEREMPEPPPEVAKQGFHRAGLRCRQLLASHPQTARTPVFFYSFLERNDLKREIEEMGENGAAVIVHLQKQPDFGALFDQIERLGEK